MSEELNIGYYGVDAQSPAYRLTKDWGSRYEKIPKVDKFALISVLANWLSEDDDEYGIKDSVDDCEMFRTKCFYSCISFLTEQETVLTPDDALAMMLAMTQQIREGVFVDSDLP